MFPGANLPRLPSSVGTVSQPLVGDGLVQPTVDVNEDQQPDMQEEFQPADLVTTTAGDTDVAHLATAEVTSEAPEQNQPDALDTVQESAARPLRARRPRKAAGSVRSPVRRSRSAKPAATRKRPEPV